MKGPLSFILFSIENLGHFDGSFEVFNLQRSSVGINGGPYAYMF